jgi:hypothetical protein
VIVATTSLKPGIAGPRPAAGALFAIAPPIGGGVAGAVGFWARATATVAKPITIKDNKLFRKLRGIKQSPSRTIDMTRYKVAMVSWVQRLERMATVDYSIIRILLNAAAPVGR